MKATGLAIAAVLPLLAVPASADTDVRIGVGITIGRPTTRPYGYDHGRGYANPFRYGYDRGRSEGSRDGWKDGERGHRFELYQEGDYRDCDKGYKGWMGPRGEYAHGYRRGFEAGYRQAYEQGRRRYYDERRHDDRRYDDRDRCDRRGRCGHDHHDDDDRVIYEEPYRRW